MTILTSSEQNELYRRAEEAYGCGGQETHCRRYDGDTNHGMRCPTRRSTFLYRMMKQVAEEYKIKYQRGSSSPNISASPKKKIGDKRFS